MQELREKDLGDQDLGVGFGGQDLSRRVWGQDLGKGIVGVGFGGQDLGNRIWGVGFGGEGF